MTQADKQTPRPKTDGLDRESNIAPEVDVVEIDPKVLSLIVCPKTREPLVYDREAHELISKKAGLAYPVRSGIPILLVEEARTLKA